MGLGQGNGCTEVLAVLERSGGRSPRIQEAKESKTEQSKAKQKWCMKKNSLGEVLKCPRLCGVARFRRTLEENPGGQGYRSGKGGRLLLRGGFVFFQKTVHLFRARL